MSAITQSRIKNMYFGAYDTKGGAVSLGFNLHNNENLNHKLNVSGGFKHRECSQLISNFFRLHELDPVL
jgi:tRNA(adenine34) deaminase